LDTLKNTTEFLKVICIPAEREIQLIAQDSVRGWRLANINSVVSKAKSLTDKESLSKGAYIDPKVGLSVLENASSEENHELQQMWAALLVSSISVNPNDDNLIYSNLLKQLTLHEARIVNFMCKNCDIRFTNNSRLPIINGKSYFTKDFSDIVENHRVEYLESLMAHIHSLSLNKLSWGHTGDIFRYSLKEDDYVTHLIPTPLCINLYIKCIGYRGNIYGYYNR